MGEVYRARDTRLDRDVALKVLPPLFISDPERLARLEREAKVLASLNHPNIAQVYGYEAGAIAMELVEGPTLEHVIRDGGRLQLTDAMPILRQIATALEVAHEQGIVHRDLKPANVKVKEDGTVKVLDFGLAKALANDADGSPSSVSNSPTLTARSTQLGMILGTAAYMAPEQAKGRVVDRRADVWAFGSVFFEMLTGRRLFDGDDVSDVLASVLKSDPDWSVLPADLPAPVRRLLRRCLEKDPKKRLRDIGDGMMQLDEALAAGSAADSGAGTRAIAPATPASPWRRAWPFVATAAIAGLAVWGVTRVLAPASPPPALVQFHHVVQPPLRLFSSVVLPDLAISPDGRLLAYTVTDLNRPPSLHLRRLSETTGTSLRGGENALYPVFSPDAAWVAYVDQANQTIVRKVSVLGGPADEVVRAPAQVSGLGWTEQGSILFSGGGGLFRVAETGGTPVALTTLGEREGAHMWPSIVRGSSLVLFSIATVGAQPINNSQLAAVDLANGRVTRFKLPGVQPRYVASGHIVYATNDGSLRAVPFDVDRVAVTGDPMPVLEGVGVKVSGAANFDVSRDGHLVHTSSGVGTGIPRTLSWVDRTNRETPIAAPPRNYFYARLAPDGVRVSLDVRDQELDIWIWDLKRETLARLTDKAGPDQYGLWTPDGRVVFASLFGSRSELFVHRPDGVGEMRQITDTEAGKLQPFPNAITPDGKQVIFRGASAGTQNDLYVATIDGGDKSYKKLLATEHDELNPTLSPDGRFMAFMSDRSGRIDIYVRPFPDVNGGEWPVSAAGGTEPLWSPTGREIFYLAPDLKMMTVPVLDDRRGLTLGKPQVMFDASTYFFGGVGRNYDVTKDGKRFIMVKEPAAITEARVIPLVVTLNWAEQLRARSK